LRVVTNGGEEVFGPAPVTRPDFEHRFSAPKGSTWIRAEVYTPGVREFLDPRYKPPEGSDGTTGAGILPARAMTGALYLRRER